MNRNEPYKLFVFIFLILILRFLQYKKNKEMGFENLGYNITDDLKHANNKFYNHQFSFMKIGI